MQNVFDLDSFIIDSCLSDNDSVKFLINPIAVPLDGKYDVIISKRKVHFESFVYIDIDKTLNIDLDTEINVRLRHAMIALRIIKSSGADDDANINKNIDANENKNILKGTLTAKKKIKTSCNWLSPYDNLIELKCEQDKIIIRNNTNDNIKNKIGIIQYKGCIYYTIKEPNYDKIKLIDEYHMYKSI